MVLALLSAGADFSAWAQTQVDEIPSSRGVSPALSCYKPLTRQIATGGLIKDDGVSELGTLGFATILDLRDPAEGGIDDERRAAAAAGVRYINLPFARHVPHDDELAEFARIVEDAGNHPLLIHCVSANRVGVMWTLYQVRKGVPFRTAVAQGREIGMKPAREHMMRRHLGEPGCTETCPQ